MKCPEVKRVVGTGFFWQTVVEDVEGRIWEGWFDHFTKRTDWRLKQ